MTTIRNTVLDTAAFPAVVIGAFFLRNAVVIAGLVTFAVISLFYV